MQDLTDSYCERCGAHHVFAASSQKNLSLKNARVLAKGLRNFVLNDGQSMADSMTSARLEDSSSDSVRATEAFHQAFNFCLTCRQYACDNCWNGQAGACFTCAPRVERPAPDAGSRAIAPPRPVGWDPDWLDFSDPAKDAVPDDEPSLSGWPTGVLIGATATTPATPEAEAVAAAEPATANTASWPAVDLPSVPPTAQGATGKTGRSVRKAPDPQAASIWPIADELAPEMTLTPEEMMLVQAELAPAVSPTPPAPVEPEVVAIPIPHPVARRTVEEVLPVQPAPPEATRHAPAEPGGIVARLLGRKPAQDHSRGATSTPTPDAPRNPSNERWPHATPWIECPLDPSHRWVNQVAAPDGIAGEPATGAPVETAVESTAAAVSEIPALARETIAPPPERPESPPVPEFRRAARTAAQAEARTAASVRLTAVGPNENRAEGSRTERRRPTTPEPAATKPVETPAETVDWPPLGASWAPRPDTWAVSDAPHPAVVAASQSQIPFETEMWSQSTQEVMNHGTVRVCRHCALPVSTQARFCRRCGTQQA